MVDLTKLDKSIVRSLPVEKRRKWRRVVEQEEEAFARLFVEGVKHVDGKAEYYQMWDGKGLYFVFDPQTTVINLEKSRCINRPNIIQSHPPGYLHRLY